MVSNGFLVYIFVLFSNQFEPKIKSKTTLRPVSCCSRRLNSCSLSAFSFMQASVIYNINSEYLDSILFTQLVYCDQGFQRTKRFAKIFVRISRKCENFAKIYQRNVKISRKFEMQKFCENHECQSCNNSAGVHIIPFLIPNGIELESTFRPQRHENALSVSL